MTQRNPLNDRYNNPDEKRAGKTRKSSASAKPKAQRAATVRDPAPKSKKQKKEEARERERKAAQKANAVQARFEETEQYKRLRRIWWIGLGGAIVCTVFSFIVQANAPDLSGLSMGLMIVAYVCIFFAFYIDLSKIRKARKAYNESYAASKSKEARKEQKKLRAEMREQEKEAAQKYEQAKAEDAAKKESGFLSRFRKSKTDETATDEATTGEAE